MLGILFLFFLASVSLMYKMVVFNVVKPQLSALNKGCFMVCGV